MASISTSTLKTAVLAPGECIILPQGAVVQAVILDGAASVTSTCGDLPAPSSYKCGYFYFICDVDDNDGHSMDEDYTYYTSVKVGGTTYILNEKVLNGDNPGTLTSIGTLNLHITNLALFQFTGITRNVLSKRQGINLFFKVPEPLFNELELKVDNRGSTQYYRPIEIDCDTYPDPA